MWLGALMDMLLTLLGLYKAVKVHSQTHHIAQTQKKLTQGYGCTQNILQQLEYLSYPLTRTYTISV